MSSEMIHKSIREMAELVVAEFARRGREARFSQTNGEENVTLFVKCGEQEEMRIHFYRSHGEDPIYYCGESRLVESVGKTLPELVSAITDAILIEMISRLQPDLDLDFDRDTVRQRMEKLQKSLLQEHGIHTYASTNEHGPCLRVRGDDYALPLDYDKAIQAVHVIQKTNTQIAALKKETRLRIQDIQRDKDEKANSHNAQLLSKEVHPGAWRSLVLLNTVDGEDTVLAVGVGESQLIADLDAISSLEAVIGSLMQLLGRISKGERNG